MAGKSSIARTEINDFTNMRSKLRDMLPRSGDEILWCVDPAAF